MGCESVVAGSSPARPTEKRHRGSSVAARQRPAVTGSGLSSASAAALAPRAVSPRVIRAGRRAQIVIRGQHELSRLVGGQLWVVSHQPCGHLSARGGLIPKLPAHVPAVAHYRRIRSGDARRAYGGQEVRGGGAGWGGQRYGKNDSSGTDEDFSDHDRSPVHALFIFMMSYSHIIDI